MRRSARYWLKYVSSYNDMNLSKEARAFLNASPWEFKKRTNGVGSQVGFWNKLLCFIIPSWLRDCLWFLSVRKAADCHDVEYDLPEMYKTYDTIAEGEKCKDDADIKFLHNMRVIINKHKKMPFWFNFLPWGYFAWIAIVRARHAKADTYYEAVHYLGKKSFWEGKHKPVK